MLSSKIKNSFHLRYCLFNKHLPTLSYYGKVIKIQSRCQSEGKIYSPVFKQLYTMDNNYAKIRKNYKINVPEYFNYAHDILDQWTELDKNEMDKPLAFWFVYQNGQEVKWTYEELTRKSKKTANALKSLGAGTKWNRCLVILPKMPEWWLINVACMRLGVVLVPTTMQATAKDIEYRLKSSKSQCILTVPKLADAVDSVRDKCPGLTTKILVNPGGNSKSGWENFKESYENASDQHECVRTKSTDILQVFFTSGTTGLPKCVVHTHAGLPLGLYQLARYLHAIPQTRKHRVSWIIPDPGWVKTLWSSIINPWLLGYTVFTHEMPTFDVIKTLEVLRDYPITGFCAPPTVYRVLLSVPQLPKFKSLMYSSGGGEPLNPEIIKSWEAHTGHPIREAYGQTETVGLIGMLCDEPVKLGSMGRAFAGYQIDIVDDEGNVLPDGEKGNIGIKIKPERPLGLFVGYEDDPVNDKKCIAGDYYMTGDRAHKDKDGYFWYDCRSDDVITSSGYRIGPFEVESALQEHPDVLESGVIGVLDPEKTQIVKAYIVLKKTGKDKDPEKLKVELQEHAKKLTAPYKYPRQIEFVDVLPKTPSGKIKRAALRERSNKNA